MRITWVIAVTCIVAAAACTDRSASAPNARAKRGIELTPSQVVAIPVAGTNGYTPSVKEEQLLSRLDAVTSPVLSAGLRKALSNPSTIVGVRLGEAEHVA